MPNPAQKTEKYRLSTWIYVLYGDGTIKEQLEVDWEDIREAYLTTKKKREMVK